LHLHGTAVDWVALDEEAIKVAMIALLLSALVTRTYG